MLQRPPAKVLLTSAVSSWVRSTLGTAPARTQSTAFFVTCSKMTIWGPAGPLRHSPGGPRVATLLRVLVARAIAIPAASVVHPPVVQDGRRIPHPVRAASRV